VAGELDVTCPWKECASAQGNVLLPLLLRVCERVSEGTPNK
jgi:hypothetical protein